jgi:predicted alpha/beta superfamily hydrolase
MSFARAALFCAILFVPRDVVAQMPASTSDTLTVQSAALGQPRRVFVSVPASHAHTTRAYPVVIVLDGEAYFNNATTITTKLAGLGHFPESIVVAIPNASDDWNDRVHDMTPPGLSVSGSSLNQGGDKFLDFIERELLPLIATGYRGGAPAILVGHSSGGMIATYAAATRPAVFPVVVSIDAPIHLSENWLAKRLTAAASANAQQPLRYVSVEARFGWTDKTWQALNDVAPKTWRLKREQLEGESHESMFFLSLYQGLKYAFADYSIVGAPLIPRGTAMSAFEHYSRIEHEFKTQLPPPERALRRMVEDLLTEGRTAPARRALDWLSQGYGRQPNLAELQAMVTHAESLPPLKETVESLKTAPWPTAQQIADFVGDWRGHHWMNPAAKNATGLRIRVVDGKVIARSLDWPEPGVELERAVEYLNVTPDRLEFGYMNGMRPMGMIINTGKRNGNTLTGLSNFRGIRMPLPDGHMPPPIHFELTKQ